MPRSRACCYRAGCVVVRQSAFLGMEAAVACRVGIPVHFDTRSLKRRKSLIFALGMYSSEGRIFTPRGCALRDLAVRLTGNRLYHELRV